MTKILVCEDEPLTRQAMEDFLTPKGYEVLTASDGSEGLSTLEANPDVDIVVSDIHMKPMGGLTLLENLRDSKNQIPFILVTGQPDIESFLKAVHDLGAFEYIQKPFDFNILISVINKLLKARKQD